MVYIAADATLRSQPFTWLPCCCRHLLTLTVVLRLSVLSPPRIAKSLLRNLEIDMCGLFRHVLAGATLCHAHCTCWASCKFPHKAAVHMSTDRTDRNTLTCLQGIMSMSVHHMTYLWTPLLVTPGQLYSCTGGLCSFAVYQIAQWWVCVCKLLPNCGQRGAGATQRDASSSGSALWR